FDAAGPAARAVGWADQNDVGNVSFEGDTADVADGNEIMIKFTYTGDTDLSGTVTPPTRPTSRWACMAWATAATPAGNLATSTTPEASPTPTTARPSASDCMPIRHSGRCKELA